LRHSHNRNRAAAASHNRKGNSGEPQRIWVPGSLPDGTLDYIGPAIANFSSGRHFCELGWEPAFPRVTSEAAASRADRK
jgi:hypothetical protein